VPAWLIEYNYAREQLTEADIKELQKKMLEKD
jgi:hypothetical protein